VSNLRATARALSIFFASLCANVALAQATQLEIDAAKLRLRFATEHTYLLVACGYFTEGQEARRALRVSQLITLTKDDLAKKISVAEFYNITANLMTEETVSSIKKRAKETATPELCGNDKNTKLAEGLKKIIEIVEPEYGVRK
jgi:hypothetical protein